mgnify:CR=1 FL=1
MVTLHAETADAGNAGNLREAAVIEASVQAIAQGAPRLLRYELRDPSVGDLAICGGEAEVFIDVIAPRPTLLGRDPSSEPP